MMGFRTLIFAAFWGTLTSVFGQWVQEAEIVSFPASEESLREWENPAPECVEIRFDSEQKELVFRFLKPFSERVEIRGPEFVIPAVPESTVKRSVPLRLKGRTPGMFDGQAALSITTPDGHKFSGVAGNRDFQTAAVILGARSRDGIDVSDRFGCKTGGTKETRARLMVDFTVPDGRGEFRLKEIALSQKIVQEHRIQSEAQGNVFFAEQGECRVSWALPEQMTGAVVRLKDENGQELRVLEVPAQTRETLISLENRGFYTIQADAKYEDGRTLQTLSTAAVLGPAVTEEQRLHSRFGLMLCHMSGDFAKKLGCRWTSGWFNFNAIQKNPDGTLSGPEPSKDSASGKEPKREFNYVAAGSGSLPLWLRKPDTPANGLYSPNDWEKLGECAELWARTCENIPAVIGPYHEVNAAWKGSFTDLIRYHNVVSRAFKKGRPEIPVAGPVFCNIDLEYFERCVKAGILNDNDGVNIHPYVNGTAPEEDFLAQIQGMQSILRANGLGQLPIYFTEFGWTSFEKDWQKPVDSLTRARYCARSLILCTALNIRAAVYFAGRFDEPEDVEHYWIVRSNYTPYPTLVAYAQAVKELVDVPDGGRFMRLTPDLFAAFFTRNGKGLLVLWTRDGTTAKCTLPETPSQVRAMTGALLDPTIELTVTPSPIYVELPNCDFSHWKEMEKRTLLPGDSIQNSSRPLFTSGTEGEASAKEVRFPQEAQLGPYAVITREKDTFSIQEVELTTPLTASFRCLEWDGRQSKAVIHWDASACVKSDVSGTLELDLDGREAVSVPFSVSASSSKSETDVTIPVSVRNGERLTGTARFLLETPLRRTLEVPLDLTPLVVPLIIPSVVPPTVLPESSARTDATPTTPEIPEDVDWSLIPVIALEPWLRPGDLRSSELSSATAELQIAATDRAFRLRLVVHDKTHCQKPSSWSFMAQGDSLRLGFDFDGGKPWEFNNIQSGLNGHRVLEYGLSLDEAGKHQWWLNRSWVEGMKAGPAFNLIPGTKIVRDESAGTTTYDLTFLWKDLGGETAPSAGDAIGFSLLIIDKNPDESVTFLPFGRGLRPFEPLDWHLIRLEDGHSGRPK